MALKHASSAEAYEDLRQLWLDHSDELMGRAVDEGASPAGAMQLTEDAYVELFKGWKQQGGSVAQLESYVDTHAASFADHASIPDGWRSVSERSREVIWFTRPRWVNFVVLIGAVLIAGALLLTLLSGDDNGDPVLDDLTKAAVPTSLEPPTIDIDAFTVL
jgi:hypothetical protein